MLTFNARKINTFNIPKNNNKESQVSLVKLNEYNIFDKLALYHAKKSWGEDNYVHGIYYDFSKHRLNKYKDRDYFAITSQKYNTTFLNPFKLLGFAELSGKDSVLPYLDYIQVNPKHKFKNQNRKFKHVGQTLIKYITDNVIKSKIYLNAAPHAVEFYLKQGFRTLPDNIMIYMK